MQPLPNCNYPYWVNKQRFTFINLSDENLAKNIESAKNLVKNDGIQNWFTGISLRTTSKKYGYLNNILLLGKGKKLRVPSKEGKGIVSYDLYKPNY